MMGPYFPRNLLGPLQGPILGSIPLGALMGPLQACLVGSQAPRSPDELSAARILGTHTPKVTNEPDNQTNEKASK